MKAWISYSSSADSRVFSARCVILGLLFAFIRFNHKFHEQSQACPHHWASLDSVSSPWGTFLWLVPQIGRWNTIYQWRFRQFSEFQAPLHKRGAAMFKTFCTVHWNIYESIQGYIKQPVSLLGFNMAQSWKSLLWSGCGKWNAHCSNIGCLVDQHCCSEISKINSVTATEILWWRSQRRSLWPMRSIKFGKEAIFQFAISSFKPNEMYALSYRVNFI